MHVVRQTVDRDVAEQHKPEPLPVYEACAVWYPSSPDETSIVAEITDDREDCGAVIW
jgi:hypothetical protein